MCADWKKSKLSNRWFLFSIFQCVFEFSHLILVLSQVLEFNDEIEKLLSNSSVLSELGCHYWLVFVVLLEDIFGTYIDKICRLFMHQEAKKDENINNLEKRIL